MISVIVPVYKTEEYLNQCVESIINQTYNDLEILLIDDGSPDRSGIICDEFEKRDSRVRVFHTENRGIAAARNLGVKEAKGDYIGFVDSDDWIEPDMYEILLGEIEEYDADVSACRIWYVYATGNSLAGYTDESVFEKNEILPALIMHKLNVFVTNKLFKRETLNTVLFPEGKIYEDANVIHRILLNANRAVTTSRGLYMYRQREGSTVRERTMQNLVDFWDAYYDRYTVCSAIPVIKGNKQIMDKLEEQLANSAARTWWWIHRVPKNTRDMKYSKEVSSFVKANFPLFGKRNWKPYLRFSVFLARFPNSLSFAVGYMLNSLHRRIGRREN